jgi:hypothetical protein
MTSRNYKVSYGGWYQRTTLHLSEVHDFLAHGHSHLALDEHKLKELHAGVAVTEVTRNPGYLEYVQARTKHDIVIRYYEDGLYVLETESEDLISARIHLEKYYEEHFAPAIGYIFSLGAPTPKILANIKTTHPTVVSVTGADSHTFVPDVVLYGEAYAKLSSNGVTMYKTPDYIFLSGVHGEIEGLVEMQIFFREFKDQLEKYLGIHRSIWEEISAIKEGASIKGAKVEEIRGRLDDYQKTISLIDNRINQMGAYVATRSSIAKHLQIEDELRTLFEYKFETLSDTLLYIKEVWKMTTAYLLSAIQNLVEIKNQTTSNNLQSLQTITSIGVISGVLGYLSNTTLPEITRAGVVYFIILFSLTWLLNFAITTRYKNKKYSLSFGGRVNL